DRPGGAGYRVGSLVEVPLERPDPTLAQGDLAERGRVDAAPGPGCRIGADRGVQGGPGSVERLGQDVGLGLLLGRGRDVVTDGVGGLREERDQPLPALGAPDVLAGERAEVVIPEM